MNQLTHSLRKLDVMNQTQVDIMLFFLSAGVIAMLAVLILSQPQEALLWKIAITICIVLTTAGMIVAFTPPPFAKYAPLFRLWGLFIMVLIALILRFKKTEGWTLVRVSKYNLLVYALLGVIGSGLIAMPFFTVVTSQEKVETKQNSIFGLVSEVLTEIRGLRADLKQDRIEREKFREEFKQDIKGVSGGVQQSLQNDKQVKKALSRANRASRTKQSPPLIIVAPAPRQLPQASFELPTIKQPATTTPTRIRGRKVGLVDQVYDLDNVAQYRDN